MGISGRKNNLKRGVSRRQVCNCAFHFGRMKYVAKVLGHSLKWGVRGLFHFVYGASPQHILLHLPIKLLHLPIKFASFPQQIASFPQQFASFPQQIASFPQPSFSLPQHILCHFAKHRKKGNDKHNLAWYFFCGRFLHTIFLPPQPHPNISMLTFPVICLLEKSHVEGLWELSAPKAGMIL